MNLLILWSLWITQYYLNSYFTLYFVKFIKYKSLDVFQTLLYTKETSTYNFVHKQLEFFFNFTPTYLSQIISLFQKISFTQSILFGSNFIFNLLYQTSIYINILYFRLKPEKTLWKYMKKIIWKWYLKKIIWKLGYISCTFWIINLIVHIHN